MSPTKSYDSEYRDSNEFHDDEEYVERTSTTTTEKIRRARKSRSGGNGSFAPYKDDDSKVSVRCLTQNLDMYCSARRLLYCLPELIFHCKLAPKLAFPYLDELIFVLI